jgi:hypothetical protein
LEPRQLQNETQLENANQKFAGRKLKNVLINKDYGTGPMHYWPSIEKYGCKALLRDESKNSQKVT